MADSEGPGLEEARPPISFLLPPPPPGPSPSEAVPAHSVMKRPTYQSLKLISRQLEGPGDP